MSNLNSIETKEELDYFVEKAFEDHIGDVSVIKEKLKEKLQKSILDFPTASSIILNALTNVSNEIEDCFDELTVHEHEDYSPVEIPRSPQEHYAKFIFQECDQIFEISVSVLHRYPNCLLTEYYNNPHCHDKEDVIYVDHSDCVFSITKKYMEHVNIDLNNCTEEEKYLLYDDFYFLKIDMPICLLTYDYRLLVTNTWNKKSFTFRVNNSKYVINRNNFEKHNIHNTLFQQEPTSLYILYDFETKGILYTQTIPYFNYIYQYITMGSIEVISSDHVYLPNIQKAFENFNIFDDHLWEICQYNHENFPYSHILTEHDADILTNWLGKTKLWKVLYRGSRDGFDATSFHTNCDDKGPTLTIVKSLPHGQLCVFGGFTSIPWKSYADCVPDSTAFLFTLHNCHDILPTRFLPNPNTKHVETHPNSGPIFGNLATIDLGIHNNCQREKGGRTDFNGNGAFNNTTNVSNRLFVNGSFGEANYFKVEEIEVYGLKT